MIIEALVLTAAVSIDLDLRPLYKRLTPRPSVQGLTCGITTVGYRFSGRPGIRFRYAGDEYEVPPEGFVELIAERGKTTYQRAGKDLPLEVWPLNQFGFREVPLANSMETDR